MRILVALKYAASGVSVDPLTGAISVDHRSSGLSAPDGAALEVALSLSDQITAVTVGPGEADGMLRLAWAVGVNHLVRYPPGGREHAAVAIAREAADVDVVLCGDRSPDGGSGSVPALTAGLLGAAQALGCAAVRASGASSLEVDRRVDGGGIERLVLPSPAVVSVGPEAAHLRRAALGRFLAAVDAPIEVRTPMTPAIPTLSPVTSKPYRPRPKMIPMPDAASAEARIRVLLGETTATPGREEIRAPAREAAQAIYAKLVTYGYVRDSP
ncbi:MAG: hypothetical protein GXP36_12205 [Actinobacteria bacterium]|nr:hypothetical protein [Actinomycetota bacterium]